MNSETWNLLQTAITSCLVATGICNITAAGFLISIQDLGVKFQKHHWVGCGTYTISSHIQ
jgi:hypothetical protein